MTKEEVEIKEKIRLQNVAKEWLRKEHPEDNIQSLVNLILSFTESKDKQIEELEKENTELKLKLEALEGQTPWKDIKDKSELIGKLTKAKELIKFWVNDFYDAFNNSNRYEERHKALEQSEKFLSEVEK